MKIILPLHPLLLFFFAHLSFVSAKVPIRAVPWGPRDGRGSNNKPMKHHGSFVSDPGHAITAEIPPWLAGGPSAVGRGRQPGAREAIETVGTIGLGSLWGACAGAMAKRLSMQLALVVGIGALGVKAAEDSGYLRINWDKIDDDWRTFRREITGRQGGGKGSLRIKAERFVTTARRTLEENVGTAGGFAAGFAYGFRVA